MSNILVAYNVKKKTINVSSRQNNSTQLIMIKILELDSITDDKMFFSKFVNIQLTSNIKK